MVCRLRDLLQQIDWAPCLFVGGHELRCLGVCSRELGTLFTDALEVAAVWRELLLRYTHIVRQRSLSHAREFFDRVPPKPPRQHWRWRSLAQEVEDQQWHRPLPRTSWMQLMAEHEHHSVLDFVHGIATGGDHAHIPLRAKVHHEDGVASYTYMYQGRAATPIWYRFRAPAPASGCLCKLRARSLGEHVDEGMYTWNWSPDQEVWMPCSGAGVLTVSHGNFARRELMWANVTIVLWLGQVCPLPARCELCQVSSGSGNDALGNAIRAARIRSEPLTAQEMEYFHMRLRGSSRYLASALAVLTTRMVQFNEGVTTRLQRLRGAEDVRSLRDILSPDEFTAFVCHFYE